MSVQLREAKVFAALLVSMTTGIIVLMAVGSNPPEAGAFCLSNYYCLKPVEKAISSQAVQSPNRWNRIEIYYSNTKAGNIKQLTSLNGFASPEDINCHFVICNGLGGNDGKIQSTENWQRQWSIKPGRSWYGSGQTIRMCMIADGKTSAPTNFQIKRVQELVEKLSETFDIQHIYYPTDW
ncbi:MAG: N-acetylmuramoyl-L-alanine amidase [Planctomycetota bacterium]|nr:MAG: N-acetylmuramoyl-L-alanine amidase [Planctomycetota bacterium]